MLRRMWHELVVGHRWVTESVAFNAPVKETGYTGPADLFERFHWGHTSILKRCSCGVSSSVNLIGDHREQSRSEELSELRKMAGL